MKNTNDKEMKTEGQDIIQLILRDHKPLKELIKVLKDADIDFIEKEPAFQEFAPLLLSHAKPEEQTWYAFMKKEQELDMRPDSFEGETEHAIADKLIEEIKAVEDQDEWMAKVKVLAELVEHHIQEEEGDMLPEFKKASEASDRQDLGARYEDLRQEMAQDLGVEIPMINKGRPNVEGLAKH